MNKDKIRDDVKTAMKARDRLTLDTLRGLDLREPGQVQAEEPRPHLVGDLRIAVILLQLVGDLQIACPIDDALRVVEGQIETHHDLAGIDPLQCRTDRVIADVARTLVPARDARHAQV